MKKLERVVIALLLIASILLFIAMIMLLITGDKDEHWTRFFFILSFSIFVPVMFSTVIWMLIKELINKEP